MTEVKDDMEKQVRKYKRLALFFGILAAIMLIITIYSLSNKRSYENTIQESEDTQLELQRELDSTIRVYEAMKQEYGDLNQQLSSKDSAILAQAQEIKKLIESQGDYRRIKKKLALLQDQGKEYVHLLDSLYVVAEQLKSENTDLKTDLSKVTAEREEIKEEKEQLQQKVSQAAKFKAYNTSLRGITNKGDETEKSRRVAKIRAAFTLSENTIVEPKEMNIYARISLPDGRVLAVGSGDGYSFINEGKRLQYTIKETFLYDKKAKQMNLFWELKDGDKAVPGVYHVQLFTDEDFIGEASMTLK